MSEAAIAALEAKLKQLEADNADLKARVQEAEDVRKINEVFYKWHYECTGGFNGKQAGRMGALECLTDDATIEIPGKIEPGKGPKGIKEFTEYWDYFYGDAGPLPYVFQVPVAEKVEVHGDTAVQKHTMLGLFQNRGAKPRLGLAQRTNDLVRTPQGWRIKRTTIDGGLAFFLDVELMGALNALPPEEPRTRWTYKGD